MSAVLNGVRKVGAYTYFAGACMRSAFTHGVPWDRVVSESYKVGVRSFPVLFTMALFVGSNLAIQGYAAFSTLGAGSLVGMFVALAGVREVCPLLAATMVAAKAGTEMAAQLAVMRTKEQIDAIEVMAIDPRSELVVPSIIAVMITLPALTVFTIFVSLVSAMAVAVLQLGVDQGEFLSFLVGYLSAYDLFAATLKSVVFGAIIATVSGYFGFYSERGARGVGEATNRAVVTMCIVIITLNFALTSLLYG